MRGAREPRGQPAVDQVHEGRQRLRFGGPSASPSACSARGSGSGSCASRSSTRWRSASAAPSSKRERARRRCRRRRRGRARSRHRRRRGRVAAATARATSAASSGRSSRRRQRERMVGSTRPGAWLTSSSSARARRLLQHLEQRVGAFALQVVDGIDDGDAPAALARGRAEERDGAAHVFDADVGVELAGLLVDRRARAPADRPAPARRCGARPDDRHRPQAMSPSAPPAARGSGCASTKRAMR